MFFYFKVFWDEGDRNVGADGYSPLLIMSRQINIVEIIHELSLL